MNRLSFLDELVKLDAMRPLIEKHASIEPAMPAAISVRPADVKTRLPRTGHLPSQVPCGTLGPRAETKEPIDRDRFNRAYREQR